MLPSRIGVRLFCGPGLVRGSPLPPPVAPVRSWVVDRMAARKASWELSLPAPSSEQRAKLERAGENAALVKRCALKATGGTLECFFSFHEWKYPYEVCNLVLAVDGWRPVAFNKRAWLDLARSCDSKDFVRDRDEQGARSDLHAASAVQQGSLPTLPAPAQQQSSDMEAEAVSAQLSSSNAPPTPSIAMMPPPPPLTPRNAFTAAALTPKAPRFWTSLADAMPALTVQLATDESAEEQATRLQLPHVNPRSVLRQSRHRHMEPPLRGVTPGHNPHLRDTPWACCDSDVDLDFLFALYCIAEGVDRYEGMEFHPERWKLPQHASRHVPRAWGGTEAIVPRDGDKWYKVYDRTFSGKWPSWWQGADLKTKVQERERFQARVLLARAVLNQGNTLAIQCLCLCHPDPDLIRTSAVCVPTFTALCT